LLFDVTRTSGSGAAISVPYAGFGLVEVKRINDGIAGSSIVGSPPKLAGAGGAKRRSL
jgi:hypothetical protein